MPVEIYTSERKAGFLLSNAIDAEDSRAAVANVSKLGLEPARIPHLKAPRGPGLTRGTTLPRAGLVCAFCRGIKRYDNEFAGLPTKTEERSRRESVQTNGSNVPW
jgi:hypothetical protein